MDPQELSVTLVTFAIAFIVTVLPMYFYMRAKYRKLQKASADAQQNWQEKYAELAHVGTDYADFLNLLEGLKSKRYDEMVRMTWDRLKQGIIKLTVNDYYSFWTGLHGAKDIVFFRCTSRIDPVLWQTPEMAVYQNSQCENVEFLSKKPDSEKKELDTIIKKALVSLNGEKLDHGNFERIFIIDDDQRSDDTSLEALISTLQAQSKFFDVKAICISKKEIPLPDRPQDFGIVVSANGDVALMDLEVSEDGEAGGGRLVFEKDEIQRYAGIYRAISQKCSSDGVIFSHTETWSKEKIRDAILSLQAVSIFGENRCLRCFQNAEEILATRWEGVSKKSISEGKLMWLHILDAENTKTAEIVASLKPHWILEIGCGPGRIIQKVLSTATEHRIPLERIVGFEQNAEIYREALERFITEPRVLIQHILFGNGVGTIPYEDDFFDLAIGVSNIVGWQNGKEEDWISEVCRVSKSFFFTVYTRGSEDRRIEMYKALGCPAAKRNGQIELRIVDAFGGASHITKSYDENDVRNLASKICAKYRGATFDSFAVGDYMIGCIVSKYGKQAKSIQLGKK
jgi:SAM-dependent methyltransferase